MFTCSDSSLFLEYFRVPYHVDAKARGQSEDLVVLHAEARAAPLLAWPKQGTPRSSTSLYRLHDFHVVASVRSDGAMAKLARALPGHWVAAEPMLDREGHRAASVWRSADGSVLLPFDPGAAMTHMWAEDYLQCGHRARWRSHLSSSYYRVRPCLPRAVQIWLRRRYSRLQRRREFPAWPVEPGLHELYAFLFHALAGLAGEAVPYIAPWPDGRSWALVLTHDVETGVGLHNLERLRSLELRSGYRSSWNFVPERYSVPDELVAQLQRDGFEVGVHGLRHDGRDLDPSELGARLPGMREAAARWGAVGFRAPATQRDPVTMTGLGFAYDASFPDTDPFEPQPGGCGTWLPFMFADIVELPITLVQDHTLFVILRCTDEQMWIDKAAFLREAGGLVQIITHPDYVDITPLESSYRRFLDFWATDETVWRALPREVAVWWRNRMECQVVRIGGSWSITGGPGATRARLCLVQPARVPRDGPTERPPECWS